MKRIIAGIVIGFMIGAASTVAAQTETVKATFSKFVFVVNGHEQQLNADPVVIDGMTYLPVRAVANLLGYAVKYDKDQRKIELVNPNDPRPQENEWISLREIAENYDIIVTAGGEYAALRKGDRYVRFSYYVLEEKGAATFETPYGPLNVKISSGGGTYLSKSDWERIYSSMD